MSLCVWCTKIDFYFSERIESMEQIMEQMELQSTEQQYQHEDHEKKQNVNNNSNSNSSNNNVEIKHRPAQTVSESIALELQKQEQENYQKLREERDKLANREQKRVDQLKKLVTELKKTRDQKGEVETLFRQLNQAIQGVEEQEENKIDTLMTKNKLITGELNKFKQREGQLEHEVESLREQMQSEADRVKQLEEEHKKMKDQTIELEHRVKEEQQRADRLVRERIEIMRESTTHTSPKNGSRYNNMDIETGTTGVFQPSHNSLPRRLSRFTGDFGLSKNTLVMIITSILLLIGFYFTRFS